MEDKEQKDVNRESGWKSEGVAKWMDSGHLRDHHWAVSVCASMFVCLWKMEKNEAFEQRPGGRGGFGLLYRD